MLNQYTHSIRASQVVSTYGIGAMVDFIDRTLMLASPEYWNTPRDITIHDERLEKLLGVREFKMPPNSNCFEGLPFVRFPKWYFCPACRKFQPLEQWKKELSPKGNESNDKKPPFCLNCKVKLVPAGIITICPDGHIDDFPWIKWVHYRSKKSICNAPKIKIKTGSGALGLEGIQLECSCGAKTTMKGAFNDGAFEKIGEEMLCTGNMPWKGKREKCLNYPSVAQRGALNVYFPKIETSIVIPPYSDELNIAIEKSNEYIALLSAIDKAKKRDKLERFLKEDLDDYVEEIATEIKKSQSAVKAIINRKLDDSAESKNENTTKMQYREEEYDALTGKIPVETMSSKDFKIEERNISEYNLSFLEKVVLVEKLREVRALVGFTRINPPENSIMGESDSNLGKSKLVNVKEKETRWYPAYETRGEGIFIELKEEVIQEWIINNPKISERISKLNYRYNINSKKNNLMSRNITEKFVLLHTLSHLLIRELSFECGYSAASLQERIYCNEDESSKTMSGILIYTSSGDSEGTLGGLVRQGYADFLPKIIKKAIEKSLWCSVDPVCIESESQGRNSLNLSACHACTLIPETSCEEFNVLLDRALLVGTLEDRQCGFLKDYI